MSNIVNNERSRGLLPGRGDTSESVGRTIRDKARRTLSPLLLGGVFSLERRAVDLTSIGFRRPRSGGSGLTLLGNEVVLEPLGRNYSDQPIKGPVEFCF